MSDTPPATGPARKPTPSELIEAMDAVNREARVTGKNDGDVVCPWCRRKTAHYVIASIFSRTVWCPCGFGLKQGR